MMMRKILAIMTYMGKECADSSDSDPQGNLYKSREITTPRQYLWSRRIESL